MTEATKRDAAVAGPALAADEPSTMPHGKTRTGAVAVVAIGRNEGDRLRRCIASALTQSETVIYVDSGSTDGSPDWAAQTGTIVVGLDLGRPFTAARARNAGFERAIAAAASATFVQFVDGDCELEPGWLNTARNFLEDNPDVAAVFGRRRERFPENSIYNRLCDMEWNVAAGDVDSCGGDVLIRTSAFRRAGGYRPGLIAGEEPELCVRLRRAGWRIHCLAVPMTIHDAEMTHFGQWWRRSLRSGHAYAEGAALHGGPPEYHSVRESRRIWMWGAALPAVILGAGILVTPLSFLLSGVYPAQIVRLYLKKRGTCDEPFLASLFNVTGYFPEALGQMKYHVDRMLRRGGHLIEYK